MTVLMKATITLAVVWGILLCWSHDERLRGCPWCRGVVDSLLDLVAVALAVNFLVTLWT